jgi:hypothetical protein
MKTEMKFPLITDEERVDDFKSVLEERVLARRLIAEERLKRRIKYYILYWKPLLKEALIQTSKTEGTYCEFTFRRCCSLSNPSNDDMDLFLVFMMKDKELEKIDYKRIIGRTVAFSWGTKPSWW